MAAGAPSRAPAAGRRRKLAQNSVLFYTIYFHNGLGSHTDRQTFVRARGCVNPQVLIQFSLVAVSLFLDTDENTRSREMCMVLQRIIIPISHDERLHCTVVFWRASTLALIFLAVTPNLESYGNK